MSRRIVRLTLDHLDAMPAPCRSCLFWELDPVRRAMVEDPRAEKDAWVSHVLREWGSCGRVALVDDEPVGYAMYAPEAFVPGAASFPTAPVSPDAVLLTTVYVAPSARGGGLGRMLVQGTARDLIQRGGIRAVEAFGDTRGRSTVRAAHGVPGLGRLQDATSAQHHPADADGPPLDAHLEGRGGGRAGAPDGCCAPVTEGDPDQAVRPAGSAGGAQLLMTQPLMTQLLMNVSSSLSSVAFGRAPTIDFTTSPPW